MASIVLTGGGTGGHLSIVRAVKEALLERGVKPGYIGSLSGQDRAWFEGDPTFVFKAFLPTGGVVNRKGLAKIKALSQIGMTMLKARHLIKQHGVTAVLSVGGFSAAPAALAALSLGLPLYIHEQNAVKGRLNALLTPFAKSVLSSYGPGAISYPVAAPFFETARERESLERIIFLGGSQGAKAINDFALEAAPWLAQQGITIIHQTGERDYERVCKRYEALGMDVEIFAFSRNLHQKIASADLAVTRAGASTLWELVANRLPALFIPYPYAAGDHQYYNAKYITDLEGGWLVRQEALDIALLKQIAQSGKIVEASRRLKGVVEPDGARSIAERLLQA